MARVPSLPTPRLASALARCARLDPAGLAADAKPGARMAKRPKRLQPVNIQLEAAQRALRVLEVIHRHTRGVSRTQIARETGLPKLHLADAIEHLVRTQLANPVAPGVYVAGSSFKLAESGSTASALLRETLAFLRDEVGAAVYVAAYTDGEVSITQHADSPTAPAVHEWVDFREAAHASAVGKALLVQLAPPGALHDQAGSPPPPERHRYRRECGQLSGFKRKACPYDSSLVHIHSVRARTPGTRVTRRGFGR